MAITEIIIADVKNIGSMSFPMPPPGVFVLTGENGSGKTTLLACLARIGQPDSFQRHFRTSLFSKRLDPFDQAQIAYNNSNAANSVSYTYSGYRWEPTPKKNGPRLLINSGFHQVLYIAADEARVTPRPEDFKTNRIRNASAFIRTHATTVFSSQKFNNLKRVNVKRGIGSEAFVLENANGTLVSEKNFSLGELAVLKLLRKLESSPANSLIIIDELEIALHPLAQEKLLQVLRGIATEKQLTVIFSTHSATLIRATKPKHLLFLERSGSNILCIKDCYPSYALGRIAPLTDIYPDILLLVEDLQAQYFLQALVKAASSTLFQGVAVPTILCQPVGTWDAVVRFFGRSHAIFGQTTKTAVVLDFDCQPFFVAPAGHPPGTPYVNPNTPADVRAIYAANQNAIKFLPSTPEFGLINEVSLAHAQCFGAIAHEFTNNSVLTIPPPQAVGPANTPQTRALAKTAVRDLVAQTVLRTGRSETEVFKILYEWYVERLEHANAGSSAQLLGPLLN